MTRYLIIRQSIIMPFSSEDELMMLVRRENKDAKYLTLAGPIAMVQEGFAADLIDLQAKHPDLIEMWQEYGSVIAIYEVGWDFFPGPEAPSLEALACGVLNAEIISHERALDHIRRCPTDRLAILLAGQIGMRIHPDPVQDWIDPIYCRLCGAMAYDLGDGLCGRCR